LKRGTQWWIVAVELCEGHAEFNVGTAVIKG
jgi:hypothetical protein